MFDLKQLWHFGTVCTSTTCAIKSPSEASFFPQSGIGKVNSQPFWTENVAKIHKLHVYTVLFHASASLGDYSKEKLLYFSTQFNPRYLEDKAHIS